MASAHSGFRCCGPLSQSLALPEAGYPLVSGDCLAQFPQSFGVTKCFEILLKAMDPHLRKKNNTSIHSFKKYSWRTILNSIARAL